MGRRPSLTQKERGRIDGLREGGLSISAIAKRTNRSRDAVSRYLQDPEGYGKRKKTKGNTKLSPHATRHLLREGAKGNSSAAQLKFQLSLPVSKRRIQQILSSADHLQYRKYKIAPPLTAQHIAKRLEWARERHAWTPGQWSQVIFSDEKKWNLDGPDGFSFYWHDLRKSERFLSRRQNGGGGVMVWGAFCESGFSKLAFLSGNQDAVKYTQTINDYLVPFSREKFSGTWLFQQDNASIHTAHITRDWFKSKNVRVMPWPARSPDLNPIENVWGVLSRRVYRNGRQFSDVKELRNAIVDEWTKMERELRYNLVKSMTKRCVQVLERGGKKTDY